MSRRALFTLLVVAGCTPVPPDPGTGDGGPPDAGCNRVCGDGRVECGEVCDYAAGPCCNTTCDGYANGTTCRAAAGPCDVAEVCDGTTGACPADVLRNQDVCRPSNGDCDVEEHCDGTSADCPADDKRPVTTLCRASAGPCDLAEYCTGTTDSCPANALADAGTSCRAAMGDCDLAEVCDGLNATCPMDVLAPSGTTCRAAAGTCDLAETCSGSSSSCPADQVVDVGTPCRPALTSCDLPESCTGSSGVCPTDVWKEQDAGCAPAKVTPSLTAHDFGSIAVGTTATRTMTLNNDGGLPHVPAPVFNIGGASPNDFAVVSQCTGNLLPGSSCQVDLQFRPTTLAFKSALVTYSPPSGTIALNGNALFPATLSVLPTVFQFSPAQVGGAPSAGSMFTVFNGVGAARSGTVALSTSDPQFVIASAPLNSCGSSTQLVGGGSCNFLVQFVPATAGAHSAVLTISATPGGTLTVPLSGTGTP